MRSWPRRRREQAAIYCIFASATAQHSVAKDDDALSLLHKNNAFFTRELQNSSELEVGIDVEVHGRGNCPKAAPHNLRLVWTTKLGASVYSTPLLVPTGTNGDIAVWANTFVRYTEALHGVDGHELPGWPHALVQSTFHTSPLAYDVDGDGVDEMLLLS